MCIRDSSKFEDIESTQIFHDLMHTNFFGYMYCTKHALPWLKRSKGQIVVISSLSGEVGLPYRTAYCASKFSITGFFEALRFELEDKEVSITIACPPSVKTNMRNNDLLVKSGKAHVSKIPDEAETRISVEECVKTIVDAADRRARKIYFPMKTYLAVYLRPFFPDFVDGRLKRYAKL
eukprot:TRINITY_DN2588_c0_g1_i1.p1 TRINITY_DN2588_c0_g1~~TRINITY_DN2588_c0_g1_i1.p1  ORF type:complete len:178 (+),score=29.08 TRINITY_DN2588_c0_g1_i1:65-598(+)